MTQPNVLEYRDHQERRHTPRPLSLHCLIDRYYDPTTGQFLSVDPAVDETGQPYAYTGDDPVDSTDPMGLCSTGGDFIVAGACHWTSHTWVFATEAAIQDKPEVDLASSTA
jgi:RHS repeat-associated protein